MPNNTELLRLTKEATSAFNAYKSALRQKGHKISGEINLAELTGLSGWERQLRRDWLAAVKKCENEAGCPAQGSLDMDVPEFDPTIPTEDPAITEAIEYTEEDGGKYVVKRVGPERFQEFVNVESSAGLRKKSPTAKSIELIGDVSYVVTKVVDADNPEAAKVYLTPCAPAAKDKKGEGFFKCGKDRWKIAGDPIIIKIAPVAELTDAPDPGNMEQADPLEWVKNFVERGFATELDGEKVVFLAPRSFAALRAQIAPDLEGEEVDTLYVPTLDMNVLLKGESEGVEIDGWEEAKPEAPALEVVEGGPTAEAEPEGEAGAESVVPFAEGDPATADQEAPVTTADVSPPSSTEVAPGKSKMVDYQAAYDDVNKWNITFNDEHEGIPTHVSVKFGYTGTHDLFCIAWTDKPNPSYEPVAWLCDSAHVSRTKQGMGDFAKDLCASTLELRLSE